MAKVRIVKCQLVKNGGAPSVMDLRYVPLSEFTLWEYFMQHKYGWKVLVLQTSYWMDQEQVRWEMGEVAAERLERVDRVVVEWLADDNLIIPQERFFPEDSYDYRKEQFLKHYPTHKTVNEMAMIARRVEETVGYFIKSRAAENANDESNGENKSNKLRASA